MKKIMLVLLIFTLVSPTFGQDITGQWNGLLDIQGTHLRLVFHIAKNDNGYSATMDSPDQGAHGIPVSATLFENMTLQIKMPNLGITYNGVFNDHTFKGTFIQGGLEVPLDLSKKSIEKPVVNRPQEPKKPYSYYSEEVTFPNTKANLTLTGTLTLPKKEGKYPVVVLISGSGPQNRDEELMGHKPFLIIADHLTKNGIAVLRYDDRGYGASTGDFEGATSVDFASDVKSAVAFLKSRKEIDHKKIGLIGHSEGGLIAPMVASSSKDVSFIVLLAGPGIRGDKLLLLQQELIARASGISETEIQKTKDINTKAFELVIKSTDPKTLRADLTKYLKEVLNNNPESEALKGMTENEFVEFQVNLIAAPWMTYFMKYNPVPALEKTTCPVLAINGEKDLQVPPKENLTAIRKALEKGGNKNATIIELPNLNHLFQECETGAPNEYGSIEQTFSPLALEKITNWISEQVK